MALHARHLPNCSTSTAGRPPWQVTPKRTGHACGAHVVRQHRLLAVQTVCILPRKCGWGHPLLPHMLLGPSAVARRGCERRLPSGVKTCRRLVLRDEEPPCISRPFTRTRALLRCGIRRWSLDLTVTPPATWCTVASSWGRNPLQLPSHTLAVTTSRAPAQVCAEQAMPAVRSSAA